MTLISIRQQLPPRGGFHCLLLFDERRVRLDPSIVARTGFWLSFFRFQGATSHTTKAGGAKYTVGISPDPTLELPLAGILTLPARDSQVQIT